MTTFRRRYDALLTSPNAAVARIADGSNVVMGIGAAQPPALLAALADRARARQVAGLRLYYMLSMPAAEPVLRPDVRHAIQPVSLFHASTERRLDSEPSGDMPGIAFLPAAFNQIPHVLCDKVGVDVFVATVAPMDADGWFNIGTNIDYALACANAAKTVILEVNPAMPRVAGQGRVHLDRVTALIEYDAPLVEAPTVLPTAEDAAIGRIVAELIEDGDCLQMGIGAVPDAVCAALSSHRHLGIHTELLTPGLVALIKSGAVDNSRKAINPGRSVFTFALGDRALYDFLDGNDAVEGLPVEYTNDPAVIGTNDRMVSINATLEIDLSGACNSECLGVRQYSGSGGQLDFVRGARRSRGGRSIIACHSTAANRTVSRIVPRLQSHVTTPRNDTHIVVTEYGYADLVGKTVDERAGALIALADPKFRDSLTRSWLADLSMGHDAKPCPNVIK